MSDQQHLRRNRCRRIGCQTPPAVTVDVEGVRPETWCADHAEEVIAVAHPLNVRTYPVGTDQAPGGDDGDDL